MSYYEYLEHYSSEQLMPEFPFLWMAKMYARHDSVKHPECIAQVYNKDLPLKDGLVVQYQNGKEIPNN